MAICLKLPIAIGLFALIACGSQEPYLDLPTDLKPISSALSPWDGTPEGMALVDFLNDGETTEYVLDHEVGLDSRAAGNLIAHRDGGDNRFGTTDDDLYQSIAEVDRIRWVGPRTIEKMLTFVWSIEIVPEYDETLGTWDGVRFTVSQATDTLEFANAASEHTLDQELGLDSRAVQSILDARPVQSVAHLAGLYFVGKTALRTLKNASQEDL